MASSIPGLERDWLPCWQIRLYFFYGANELAAFAKCVMRAGLFHIDVFPRLAGPDGDQRVPVIGSCDGDGVNVFVFEKLAGHRRRIYGLGEGRRFLDLIEALARKRFRLHRRGRLAQFAGRA